MVPWYDPRTWKWFSSRENVDSRSSSRVGGVSREEGGILLRCDNPHCVRPILRREGIAYDFERGELYHNSVCGALASHVRDGDDSQTVVVSELMYISRVQALKLFKKGLLRQSEED